MTNSHSEMRTWPQSGAGALIALGTTCADMRGGVCVREQIKAHPWARVFKSKATPEAIDLLSKILQYTPGVALRLCMPHATCIS